MQGLQEAAFFSAKSRGKLCSYSIFPHLRLSAISVVNIPFPFGLPVPRDTEPDKKVFGIGILPVHETYLQ
jgi:hypothetical protein